MKKKENKIMVLINDSKSAISMPIVSALPGNFLAMQILRLYLDLTKSETLGRSPVLRVLTSPLGDPHAHASLRGTHF